MRLTVLLLLVFLAAPAAAQDAPVSRARFTIFAAGREAGYEESEVSEENGARVLESRAVLDLDGGRRELSFRLRTDRETGRILSFSARGRSGGRDLTVTLARSDGVLAGESREKEEAEPLRLKPEPGAIVLLDPFVAPLSGLVRRYDFARGGAQTFPAVFPLAGRTGRVTLRLRGEQALEVDGRAVLARRLLAKPDEGETANLWVDASGTLLVCARSVAGLSAVRGSTLRIGLKPGEDPPDPKGVNSLRIRFSGEGAPLAGTLSRPRGVGKPPAVLLVSGSGPHDRNGNAPGGELQWNQLHSVAMALAEGGIASLRYDERGVGRSGGVFYDAAFSDLVRDARSALRYLRSREDVDPERIAVLGHSEGAMIGAVLAREAGPLRALVLVGAPAEPLDRVLLGQVRRRLESRGTGERKTQRILGDLTAFFEHVRLSTGETVAWNGRLREARWLREHLRIDPLALYRRVPCPVLLLHGERDPQVPASHARRIATALRARGEDHVRLVVYPLLDHFLIPSRGGLEPYGDAVRRVDERALRELAEWLASRF